jgi:hypothetical protein
VSVRAPLTGSPTLQLQMLRESVHWFGEPTQPVTVTVTTAAPVA